MKGALVVILALAAGCQKQPDANAIPEPSPELVQAMLDYCKIGSLPREQWLEAQRAWGFQNGGTPKVINVWNKAARDKDPVAIKVVRAAATKAMGGELACPILDVLDHKERVPKDPPQGSGAP